MRTRAARDDSIFAISALTGEGIEALLSAVTETLQGQTQETVLHLDFADGKKRAWLFAQEIVQGEEQTDDGFDIAVRWTARQAEQFGNL